ARPPPLARAMASWVRGGRSMMRTTVRVRPTAPAMARTLMIRPTGLRQSSRVPGRAGPVFVLCAAGDGDAVRSSMASSVIEKHEPRGHGPQDHHGDIDH